MEVLFGERTNDFMAKSYVDHAWISRRPSEIVTEIGRHSFIVSFPVSEKYLQDLFETVTEVIAETKCAAFDNISIFDPDC